MVSFYIRGGLAESRAFFKNVKVVTLAESLGGHESLAELACLMAHASVDAEDRARLGITESFIRLSVGLEEMQDIIDNLDQALRTAVSV